jgi:murein DD-endopeptidase MepM/ murein hydrolase activator NlpD
MSTTPNPFEGDWTFPFATLPSTGRSWNWSGRRLGAKRKNGRRHAGCDIFKPERTDVLAIGPGTVVSRVYQFTGQPVSDTGLVTFAIEIEHEGFIVRYGEIGHGTATVRKGDTVVGGQVIAKVGKVGSNPMLHFELYFGTRVGDLTDRSNRADGVYDFVPKRNYQRRQDLLDPGPYLDRMADRSGL